MKLLVFAALVGIALANPLPASITLNKRTFDPETGACTVETEIITDPERIREIIAKQGAPCQVAEPILVPCDPVPMMVPCDPIPQPCRRVIQQPCVQPKIETTLIDVDKTIYIAIPTKVEQPCQVIVPCDPVPCDPVPCVSSSSSSCYSCSTKTAQDSDGNSITIETVNDNGVETVTTTTTYSDGTTKVVEVVTDADGKVTTYIDGVLQE